MQDFTLEQIGFYTIGSGYVFINKELENSGLGFSIAGDFVITLANFDSWFFKYLLTCSTIAFANNEIAIIKNFTDADSLGNYFQSKAADITTIKDTVKNKKTNRNIDFFESILQHYIFKTFDVSNIIKFIYNDFYEIYSHWELPVTAKILLWECINALSNFQKDTPEIGIVELTELCQKQIEQYKALAQLIIENDYTIVNDLKQNISVSMNYNPKTQKALSIYYLYDLESMLAFDTVFLQASSINIKKCVNCGLYFIPENRSDEIYCNNIFKNGKTCKQLGYENKIKRNEFKSSYRTAYKTQRARIKYNSHIPDYAEKHFKPWEVAAKEALTNYQAKNDIDGFKVWLKLNKDSF
jgi:hypothetical protein